MPLPLLLALALQHPDVTKAAADSYNTPGSIDAAQLKASAADFGIQAVNCYHHTARFRGVDILGGPWSEQEKFGAKGSAVIRVYFMGMSGSLYQMDLAAMAKDSQMRAFVINDTALVPYNKNCQLEQWTEASGNGESPGNHN